MGTFVVNALILGWQTYTQEMLEYISQEATVRQEITANLSPAALHWVEEQLERLQSDNNITGNAGLFVGGDSNQVAVEKFSIQTP